MALTRNLFVYVFSPVSVSERRQKKHNAACSARNNTTLARPRCPPWPASPARPNDDRRGAETVLRLRQDVFFSLVVFARAGKSTRSRANERANARSSKKQGQGAGRRVAERGDEGTRLERRARFVFNFSRWAYFAMRRGELSVENNIELHPVMTD